MPKKIARRPARQDPQLKDATCLRESLPKKHDPESGSIDKETLLPIGKSSGLCLRDRGVLCFYLRRQRKTFKRRAFRGFFDRQGNSADWREKKHKRRSLGTLGSFYRRMMASIECMAIKEKKSSHRAKKDRPLRGSAINCQCPRGPFQRAPGNGGTKNHQGDDFKRPRNITQGPQAKKEKKRRGCPM